MPTRQDAKLDKRSRITVLCAPDSFKESLNAAEVASAMARGVTRADLEINCQQSPIADGGEGSLDTLVQAADGTLHQATVLGPLGEQIKANFGICPDEFTGIVELAEASGLSLVAQDQRNPLLTTTYGTGQLIAAATESGCKKIILCIGGSATVDCGIGIIQGMGGRFFDKNNNELKSPITGKRLLDIHSCKPPEFMPKIHIACDVTNPLLGPNGAAATYGPQKGATSQQVKLLEDALSHIAALTDADPDMPGAGAAGGVAFGLSAFCNVSIESGIDLILDAVNFSERCANADLVLTGEGCLDSQSLQGKASMGVSRAAKKLNVPCIAIVGKAGSGADDCLHDAKDGVLESYYSLADRYGLDRAMKEAAALVEELTAEVIHNWVS